MKKLYFLILLTSTSRIGYAQLETCGNPSAPIPVNSYTGWSSGLHFSGTAMVDTSNPSVLNPGYLYYSASGGGNISFINTPGTYLQISGISYAPDVYNVAIYFNMQGYDSSNTNQLSLSVSLDSGATWAPLSYSGTALPPGPSSWRPCGASLPGWYIPWPNIDDVFFRFTQTTTNKIIYIDDIKIVVTHGSLMGIPWEDFGNPSAPASVNSYTGYTGTLDFSGTAIIDTAHPSAINYLSNYGAYSFASGGGNVSLDTPGSFLQVAGYPSYIDMVYGVSIRFNLYGYDTSNPNQLALSISLDSGSTWATLPYGSGLFTNPSLGLTRTDSSGWEMFETSQVMLFDTSLHLPSSNPSAYIDISDVFFRFTQTSNNKIYIDDIEITGITLLAINLISFDATTTDRHVVFNWRANSESDRELFVLEKSKDAIHFEPIAQQKAKGKGEFDYQYTDALSPDKTFYRLKMINDNRSLSYSRVLMVGTTGNDNDLLQAVYPNPARDVVHLLLNDMKEEHITITVTDMQGVLHRNQTVPFKTGMNRHTLDTKGLASGSYFVTVTNGDRKETLQIVIK